MGTERKRQWCKISTVVGSVFVLLPNGVIMYWGNLSVYAFSYIVINLQSTYGVEGPWVLSIFVSIWTLTLMAYNTVKNWIGKRWVAVLGCLFTEMGIFGSYYTVQTSFVLLNFSMAVLTGIGTGFLQAYLLSLLVDWANNDIGCLIAILQGSFFWGSTVINQLVTLYLNPLNAVPDVLIGHSTYFTQKKILDKVPSLFLVLGGFSVATHCFGFCLIRENVFDKSINESGGEIQDEVASANGGHTVINSNAESDVSNSTNVKKQSSHRVGYGSSQTDQQSLPSPILLGEDHAPRTVLKSMTFYILWVTFFFAEYPFVLMSNYYKAFGQIWIHDDYFLTNLGTALSISNILMRIVWGLLMDKIGVRNCLALETFIVIFITAWFYFSAITNKWLYFVVTNLFSSLSGVLFSSVGTAAVAVFGKTHFATNFGLLRSSAVVLSIISPFVIVAILESLGWFYIFASAAFANSISLILILAFVPRI